MIAALPIVLLALAGAFNATMDTLVHHWKGSIFYRLAGGSYTHFFGHGAEVWKRRYIGNNPENELRPIFRNPITAWLVIPFYDAWHLSKVLMWLSIGGAFALFTGTWVTGVGAVIIITTSFSGIYWLLDQNR